MKEKAIILRRSGKTYTEISNELNVSKSIVSLWLRNYRLTETERDNVAKNIKYRIDKGRMKSKISIRSRRIHNDKVIYEEAGKTFDLLFKDTLFCYGLALYEGHGSKNTNYYSFTHKDIEIHSIMLNWLYKFSDINKEKLRYKIFVSSSDKNIDAIDFWSQSLDVPEEKIKTYIYKREVVSNKNDIHDKGILSVMYNDVKVVRRIRVWQKMLIKYYRGV